MRYLTFSLSAEPPRLGVLHQDLVVDVASFRPSADVGTPPLSILELIHRGPDYWRAFAAFVTDQLGRNAGQRHAMNSIRCHAPIPRPTKNIVCLGLNYASHAIESAAARGREAKVPKDPLFFTKSPTTVAGPFDDIPVDRRVTGQVDWEAELGLVIGVAGKNISAANALQHVFGYTVINDVTARDLQARHIQWFKGKSLDGFAPMGPCIVTSDEFGNPQDKRVVCRVNGVTKQDGSTANMIFPIPTIIETLSRGLTIEPGDIISTGTPDGVGMGRTPPEFLADGDVLETEVQGIGVMRNRIRDVIGQPDDRTD
jgi:2-keto-4-pentenoate hydratase/2-oxohepta-3-ene-1,7-dioic acid hydratase in catechol pathway